MTPSTPIVSQRSWPHAALAALASALLAALATLLLALGLLHLAGATARAVASDSMAPAFARGDLVVTMPVAAPAVGDVVTFRRAGQLVTHRLVAPGRAPGTYETRGDANPGNDPWSVPRTDMVGRVVGVVANAGWPLLLLEDAAGRLLAIAIGLGAAALLLHSWPRLGAPAPRRHSQQPAV